MSLITAVLLILAIALNITVLVSEKNDTRDQEIIEALEENVEAQKNTIAEYRREHELLLDEITELKARLIVKRGEKND